MLLPFSPQKSEQHYLSTLPCWRVSAVAQICFVIKLNLENNFFSMHSGDVRRSVTCRLLRTVYNTVYCPLSVGNIMLTCLLCSETKPDTFPLKQDGKVRRSLTYQFVLPPYIQNVRPSYIRDVSNKKPKHCYL